MNSEDQDHSRDFTNRKLEVLIEVASRVVRESKLPFGLGSLKLEFSFDLSGAAGAAVMI